MTRWFGLGLGVLLLAGCNGGSGDADCRRVSQACAIGFACVEQDGGWDCVAASDGGESPDAAGDATTDAVPPDGAPVDGAPVDVGTVDALPDGTLPTTIGQPCADGDDCDPAQVCRPETPGGLFEGGYCMRIGCSGAEPCPDGTQCVPLGDQDVCLKRCVGEADCRAGYVCDADRVCSPARCPARGAEVCDGADNDCDDAVDEDNANLLRACERRARATATCRMGGCAYTCDFGALDVDGDPITGCEVSGVRYRAEGRVTLVFDIDGYFDDEVEPQNGDPFVVEWHMDPDTPPQPDSEGRNFPLDPATFGLQAWIGRNELLGVTGSVFIDTPDELARHQTYLASTVSYEPQRRNAALRMTLSGAESPQFEAGRLWVQPPLVEAMARGSLSLTTGEDAQFNRIQASLDALYMPDYEGMACQSAASEGSCRQARACAAPEAPAGDCRGPDIVCCPQ